MRPRLLIALACAFFLPVVAAAAEEWHTVTRVINGKSLVLDSGDTLRLAGIEAPNAQEESTPQYHGRPGEPLGEEAKRALEQLTLGKKIRMELNTPPRDRHGRLLGQAYLESGAWLQGAMLSRGYAQAYSFSDDPHDLIIKMLAAEKPARDRKLGVWSEPYFRIITTDEAGEFLNRFRIVEGKVVSVHEVRGNTYINFYEQWKGRFALFISHKHAKAFAAMNLPALAGKTIRVRGWIHYHNAPMIDLTHPEEIEPD